MKKRLLYQLLIAAALLDGIAVEVLCAQLPKEKPSALPADKDEKAKAAAKDADLMTLKGDYRVEKIEQVGAKGEISRIVFISADSGKPERFHLDTYNVHIDLKPGAIIKLEAKLLPREAGAEAEAGQVLVYLPRPEGNVPVWMVGIKGNKIGIDGSSYLQMHNPQSDYQVL